MCKLALHYAGECKEAQKKGAMLFGGCLGEQAPRDWRYVLLR